MNKIANHLSAEIKRLKDYFKLDITDMTAIYPKELRYKAGIYSFWWIGDKSILVNANREVGIVGPKTASENIIKVLGDTS